MSRRTQNPRRPIGAVAPRSDGGRMAGTNPRGSRPDVDGQHRTLTQRAVRRERCRLRHVAGRSPYLLVTATPRPGAWQAPDPSRGRGSTSARWRTDERERASATVLPGQGGVRDHGRPAADDVPPRRDGPDPVPSAGLSHPAPRVVGGEGADDADQALMSVTRRTLPSGNVSGGRRSSDSNVWWRSSHSTDARTRSAGRRTN